LLDPPDVVSKKIRKAVAAPGVVEENALLAFIEYVLLPASALLGGKKVFTVDRSRDNLEPLVYSDMEQMREDYKKDIVRAFDEWICTRADLPLVVAADTEACGHFGTQQFIGSHPREVSSIERVAGEHGEGIPASGEA
jgi:hypothetical protein